MVPPSRRPDGPAAARPPARILAHAFVIRALLAGAGAFALLRLDLRGPLALCGWAVIALSLGSELLASIVFLLRRRPR